jgi:hypothetical protein
MVVAIRSFLARESDCKARGLAVARTCASMITRRHRVLLGVAAMAAALTSNRVFAKRAVPQAVTPLVFQGVRYEAPHFSNPCGQNGGCVVAYDVATGVRLWFVTIYCVTYDPGVESDVQNVFITSLTSGDGTVLINNETDHHFSIDLGTRAVSGDLRGCERRLPGGQSASGCTYGSRPHFPAAIWMLAVPFALRSRCLRRCLGGLPPN